MMTPAAGGAAGPKVSGFGVTWVTSLRMSPIFGRPGNTQVTAL
jgi:hypothetical protein